MYLYCLLSNLPFKQPITNCYLYIYHPLNKDNIIVFSLSLPHRKQGRKRPLDTPKRMIERREREGKREKREPPEREAKAQRKVQKENPRE